MYAPAGPGYPAAAPYPAAAYPPPQHRAAPSRQVRAVANVLPLFVLMYWVFGVLLLPQVATPEQQRRKLIDDINVVRESINILCEALNASNPVRVRRCVVQESGVSNSR